VERYLEELMMIKPVQGSSRGGLPASLSGWLPPPPGLAKINVDAAMAKTSDHSAAAAVARDEAGIFLGASVLVMDSITSPEAVEMIACQEALALASDLILHKFRVACDCINAVKSIHGEGMGLYGPIVLDQDDKSNLPHVEFVHERRNSNLDAHRLARSFVSLSLGRHVWFLSPPDGVCNSMMS
jgi:ribonuclease HI